MLFRGSFCRRRPIHEKPWHGGPPISPSGRDRPRIARQSDASILARLACFGLDFGKFRPYADCNTGSMSIDARERKPASSAPRENPPHPQNKSTIVAEARRVAISLSG